jgi:hypothetical protein
VTPGVTCNGNGFNSQCTVTCEGDLKPRNETIVCGQDGEWDPPITSLACGAFPSGPECERGVFTRSDNGKFQGFCDPGKANQICTLFCDAGFQVLGNPVRKCIQTGPNDAHWDNRVPPYCVPVFCQGLTAPANSYANGRCAIATPGETCTFSCNPGYVLGPIGVNPTLTCNEDGQWSGEVPVCSGKTCPSIRPPNGVLMNGICTPGKEGDICSFRCVSGYSLQGLPNVICNGDGSWSGPPPICVTPSGATPPPLPGYPPSGTQRPPPIPGRPGTVPGTVPGCRPRRRCCSYPKNITPFLVFSCRGVNPSQLPEAGNSCNMRCIRGNLIEMRETRSTRRAPSFITSITTPVKQELFLHKKIATVSCLRSQRWSGADFTKMRCLTDAQLSSLHSQTLVTKEEPFQSDNRRFQGSSRIPPPLNSRSWFNVKTNQTRLVVSDSNKH